MIVVVGSGPAGAACAYGLASRGVAVTMLDVGMELEPERAHLLERVGRQSPARWDRAELEALGGEVSPDARGLLLKLGYGSDFPYRPPAPEWAPERRDVALQPSFAKGGHSNVWGGALLPYTDDDLRGWPIGLDELAPFYRQALEIMEISAVVDDLAADFPLYGDRASPLDPSPQAERMTERMERRRSRLRKRGIRAGRARLAVRSAAAGGRPGCVYCGRCLFGCPLELIYNSAATVDRLRHTKGLSYRAGMIVEGVSERDGRVHLKARTASGAVEDISASRVYLACGAVNTTRVLLESLAHYDSPVALRDSQYFLLPLLQIPGRSGARDAESHSLAQLFLEIDDPAISPSRVHLQVYTYNELYGAAMERSLGGLTRIFRRGTDALLDRLMVAQGYLHSDSSSVIEVRLSRSDGSGPARLSLDARVDPEGRRRVAAVARKLLMSAGDTGAFPLLPLLRVGEPGRGFHAGGSFPMSNEPGRLECDTLGRPSGFDRVHVVDSTCFPTIPAGPITFTVMANALRIAALTTP